MSDLVEDKNLFALASFSEDYKIHLAFNSTYNKPFLNGYLNYGSHIGRSTEDLR